MQIQLPFRKISVIGLGYIGLPTAAMFASRKIEVVGIDVNSRTVETINRGEIHIIEPNLDIVVRSTVSEGYLRATTVPEPAEAFLIAVPTPIKGDNHEPDLSYIEAAAKAIAPVLKASDLVVLESTSPVGATARMAEWLAEARPDLTFPQDAGEASDIRIAHCPERVLPGNMMQELITNDRVIGGMTARCAKKAADLYAIFVNGQCHIASKPEVAELAKLTENSFRDLNIAFANELSIVCDKLSIDVWELIDLANHHPRVNILRPGPGVGGHCIAVDPWFIIHSAQEQTQLIKTARITNEQKMDWVLQKIEENINFHQKNLKRKTKVACLGVTFKPDIDDLRESPSLKIAELLSRNKKIELAIVEPHIQKSSLHFQCNHLPAHISIEWADIVVALVSHTQFKLINKPNDRIVIDTCGLWR